jgi:non-specific serine/threonine protein kinase
LTDREIATHLVIAPRTAEGHVAHILDKLGFRTRSEIASWSTREQLGTPPRTAGTGKRVLRDT